MGRVGTRRGKPRSAARTNPELKAALETIGATVVALRAKRSMTQEELADAADLDVKHIQDIEHGRSNLTVATVLGLARGLGVSAADLFDGV